MYLYLKDGLGNQMFMYAFCRALQLNRFPKEKIIINNKLFKQKATTPRDFELDCFKLNNSVKVANFFERIYSDFLYFFKKKIQFRNADVFNKDVIQKAFAKNLILQYPVFDFYDISSIKKGPKLVRGFFQNPKYFDGIKNTLISDFEVKHEPSKENKEMLQKIKSAENSVCLHVRRGDYVESERWSKELLVCDKNYYEQAVLEMKSRIENPTFFVFSNTSKDLEWIKNNYNFDGDFVYVNLNNPSFEELRLMYNCSHFIISNSSFSWWAQYLGQSESKTVIAPKKWSNSHEGTSGIYMNEWILI